MDDGNISGRSIVQAIKVVLHLWGAFRGSLAPHLPAGVVSALDVLADNIAAIEAINPYGPA